MGIKGDPFTLFYDYDQIRDRKLSELNDKQKVTWLRARFEMTFLEPLRRLWNPSLPLFKELLFTSPQQQTNCSFSIALMVVMLNGVEALGSFLEPEIKGEKKNLRRFQAFCSSYMKEWKDVEKELWVNFRNGIAHGFCIEDQGSLEFLEDSRFEFDGPVLRVCPRHFFADLEKGVKDYFALLERDPTALAKFCERFNEVYPN